MEMDELTEEQNNALARFREFTQIDSVETCRQYLNAHEWDVERAIETALVSNADLPSPFDGNQQHYTTDPMPSAPPEPFFDESPRTVPSTRGNAPPRPANTMSLVQLILSFFYQVYIKIRDYLPWTILNFIFAFVRSLFIPVPPVDPLREIDQYCAYFDQQYGTHHPAFYRGRLSQALADAQREVRLLFIYIHEKGSPISDRFCREVLCGEAFAMTMGDNLLWSVSTDTQEGANACRLLNAYLFPCICIVAHHGSQQTVQLKLDRYTDADECLAELINGVQHAEQILQFNRERQNDRSSRSRLLEEQNAAYMDSVRADQEKAERRRQEELERQKLEEDQRRLEEESQRKIQEFVAFRDRIRERLPAEPEASEKDIIQVSIRLPASEPIRRRFRRSDPAKLLFEFAWTQPHVPHQFELLWGYPRKRYQYESIGETVLGDVINGNTETCFLEEIDDDK